MNTLQQSLCLICTAVILSGSAPAPWKSSLKALQTSVYAACEKGDYDAAEKLCQQKLQELDKAGRSKSALYAAVLREHAAVLKHQFNYPAAQKDETDATRIEKELAQPAPIAPQAAAGPPQYKPDPPPWMMYKNAKRPFVKKRAK